MKGEALGSEKKQTKHDIGRLGTPRPRPEGCPRKEGRGVAVTYGKWGRGRDEIKRGGQTKEVKRDEPEGDENGVYEMMMFYVLSLQLQGKEG